MSEGNWRAYGDQLEMYFLANAVKEELKLPILIASMALEYELVMEMMLNHLDPKPSLLAKRYRFRQRRQEQSEKQLFANKDVTWLKSVTLAAALEGAERDAAAVETAAASGKMVGGYAPTSVAAIRQSETICSVRGSCLSCGGFGHRAVECKFRTYQCS
ncbi:putative tick transposon [Operophtera brumata]|uniref:Putative tick transposon n=1 Tax=Operophtera brumata TaxID=104452 RepID=A0A0L7LNQ2_OPEBR|nr:putative tick transposon [Operophtera brumata]